MFSQFPVENLQLPSVQVTCGAEMAVLLVETLVKGKFPYSEETLGEVLFCWCNIAYMCFPFNYVDGNTGSIAFNMLIFSCVMHQVMCYFH